MILKVMEVNNMKKILVFLYNAVFAFVYAVLLFIIVRLPVHLIIQVLLAATVNVVISLVMCDADKNVSAIMSLFNDHVKVKRSKIITLCGSTSLKKEFESVREDLENK